YNILWSSSIHVLSSVIDRDYNFLPDVRIWDKEFQRLKNEKVEGFYPDSSIGISPLGVRAIYEGQARFNQLQYLSIGSDNQFSYSDFEQIGMLKGIYVEAFDLFLKLTKIDRPDNLNNSVIALFLLVCDI